MTQKAEGYLLENDMEKILVSRKSLGDELKKRIEDVEI